jgi:hypothetical protein
VDLDHLPAGASFEVEVLDRQHGDAVTAWKAIGRRSRRRGSRWQSFGSWPGIRRKKCCRRIRMGNCISV